MSKDKSITLGDRMIGPNQPCFIIAEAGVNHNGDLDLALDLVDAAAKAGADSVKFQTFSADRIVSKTAPKAQYQQERTDSTQSQYDMLKTLELSRDDHAALMDRCRELNILFLSSPFDQTDTDFLHSLDVAGFKVPSGEITNLPYLKHMAAKAKPVIMSTGMSKLNEVQAAVEAIDQAGNDQIALLHCVSAYPADPAEVNLRAMATLADRFKLPVGYSDHTLGLEVSLAAVALGAVIIEKHFTLDTALYGPDHKASIEPKDLKDLIRGIRKIESALGDGLKRLSETEAGTAAVARKSLHAACDIKSGTTIDESMLAALRPGTGISPAQTDRLVGRKTITDVTKGTILAWEMVL